MSTYYRVEKGRITDKYYIVEYCDCGLGDFEDGSLARVDRSVISEPLTREQLQRLSNEIICILGRKGD